MKNDNTDQRAIVENEPENSPGDLRKLRDETASLCALVSTLENENRRLQQESLSLLGQIDGYKNREAELGQRLADSEAANQRTLKQYLEVEQQNSSLANLYVANSRLHGSLDRQEVLAAIQEIIINMVGSEEMGIFELNQEGSALSLVASFGIEPMHYQTIPLGSGLIGRVALTGEAYMAKEGDAAARPIHTEEANLTTCLSLKLAGKVTGVIAVFRLLQQKAGLVPLDYELLDLLAQQAATALYATGLHAKMGIETDCPTGEHGFPAPGLLA